MRTQICLRVCAYAKFFHQKYTYPSRGKRVLVNSPRCTLKCRQFFKSYLLPYFLLISQLVLMISSIRKLLAVNAFLSIKDTSNLRLHQFMQMNGLIHRLLYINLKCINSFIVQYLYDFNETTLLVNDYYAMQLSEILLLKNLLRICQNNFE